MKLLRKLFSTIATILVLGGAGVIAWQYFRNKQLFVVLLSNSIVKGSIDVLQKMALGVLAIFVGLICFLIAMKFGSIVRKNEREKKEALRAQQKENDEKNRQLRKEAEQARAEAEELAKENERIKLTLSKQEEETKQEQE